MKHSSRLALFRKECRKIILAMGIICGTTSISCAQNSPRQKSPTAISCAQEISVQEGSSEARFAIRALYQVCQALPESNVCFSPASLANVLSLTANGAQGDTRKQMMEVLCVDDLQQTNAFYRKWMPLILGNKNIDISMANMMVLDSKVPILPAFQKLATTDYQSLLFKKSGNSQSDANKINQWCSQKTKGKISNMVSPSSLSETALMLLNAVNFDAKWKNPFEENNSKTIFHTPSGHVKVPFFSETRHENLCRLSDNSGRQLPFLTMSLKYKDDNYEALFVLPDEGMPIDSIFGYLSPEVLKMCSDTKPCEVFIRIPKLDLEQNLNCVDLLKKMGMTYAFDPTGRFSDFSLMSSNPLYIGNIRQTAKVKMDEKGTQAAAVTAEEVFLCIGAEEEPPIPEFVIDRPYLFFLRERTTGLILFAGRILNPLEK